MVDQSTATAPARSGEGLQIIGLQEVFKHEEELREQIARRAYELFESRGCTPGGERDDWLSAESEIRQLIRPEMIEGQDTLTIRTEVPGFSAHDLCVAIEPRRVAISGTHESGKTESKGGTNIKEESRNHVLHLIELPAEIDPTRAIATFRGTTLEIALPKAGRSQRAGFATKMT